MQLAPRAAVRPARRPTSRAQCFILAPWLKSAPTRVCRPASPGSGHSCCPDLPREVIGTPDSDMIFVSMNTQGNTS